MTRHRENWERGFTDAWRGWVSNPTDAGGRRLDGLRLRAYWSGYEAGYARRQAVDAERRARYSGACDDGPRTGH